MLIAARPIDDFKSERKELLPPLPMVFRLVPILFYCSVVFLAVVGTLAFYHAKIADSRHKDVLQRAASVKKEIEGTKSSRAALEVKIREASDLENWVLASMPLQPLVVSIIRSMSESSSIVDLNLERDAETPSQLKLTLILNTDSDKQIERTLEAIRRLNYREFSPTQSMIKGNLEYRASLLWKNPSAESPTPESRAEQVPL